MDCKKGGKGGDPKPRAVERPRVSEDDVAHYRDRLDRWYRGEGGPPPKDPRHEEWIRDLER